MKVVPEYCDCELPGVQLHRFVVRWTVWRVVQKGHDVAYCPWWKWAGMEVGQVHSVAWICGFWLWRGLSHRPVRCNVRSVGPQWSWLFRSTYWGVALSAFGYELYRRLEEVERSLCGHTNVLLPSCVGLVRPGMGAGAGWALGWEGAMRLQSSFSSLDDGWSYSRPEHRTHSSGEHWGHSLGGRHDHLSL